MTATAASAIAIRSAVVADAPRIHALITYWAERTPVLPKSLGAIYENLRR